MNVCQFRSRNMKPLRLLQITDCHLGAEPGEKLLGLDTDQSLHDVLELVRHEQLDLIVCSGDITNEGGFSAYERYLAAVRRVFPSIPHAWLPGNHDDPFAMEQVKRLPIENRFHLSNWNFIFLDSRIPMETGGEINPQEMQRLQQELDTDPVSNTMIFMHHQPVRVGSRWLDEYLLRNSDEFFELIDQYSSVKAVAWGHVHQEFNAERNGVLLMSAPATSVQFAPNCDEFKVDNQMPGCRILTLHPNGSIESETRRVSERGYDIDFASGGY